MLDQIIKNFNNFCDKVKFFLEKHKRSIINFTIILSFICIILHGFGVVILSAENAFKLSLQDHSNFFLIFLKGGFFFYFGYYRF